MSLEAWGDDGDAREVPDGWWATEQVDDVLKAIRDLRAEPVYEGGKKENGISVRFLAQITMLEHMAGLRDNRDPFVQEADALLAEPPFKREPLRDGPYPGMAEAFQTRYGVPFDHPEWRDEAATWAAAWKAAMALLGKDRAP